MALTDKLTAIANAIRAKTGGTDTMTLEEMPSEIASISGGGAGGNYNIESVDDGNGGQILNITDAQGGGTSYVDVTLTQDYTSGALLISDVGTASGYSNFYAMLISAVPEEDNFVGILINTVLQNGTAIKSVYRRKNGAFGWYAPGTQNAYLGDVFRVWEVG